MSTSCAFAVLVLFLSFAIEADTGNLLPTQDDLKISADGTVHVPVFELPLSRYLSDEAKRAFIKEAKKPPSTGPNWNTAPIAEIRKWYDDLSAPMLARARTVYLVDIVDRIIANVRTRVSRQGREFCQRTEIACS